MFVRLNTHKHIYAYHASYCSPETHHYLDLNQHCQTFQCSVPGTNFHSHPSQRIAGKTRAEFCQHAKGTHPKHGNTHTQNI